MIRLPATPMAKFHPSTLPNWMCKKYTEKDLKLEGGLPGVLPRKWSNKNMKRATDCDSIWMLDSYTKFVSASFRILQDSGYDPESLSHKADSHLAKKRDTKLCVNRCAKVEEIMKHRFYSHHHHIAVSRGNKLYDILHPSGMATFAHEGIVVLEDSRQKLQRLALTPVMSGHVP